MAKTSFTLSSLSSLSALTGKLDATQKSMLAKLAVTVVLLITAITLFYMNANLAADNKKMIKRINKEAAIKRNYSSLQSCESLFTPLTVKLGAKPDLEKMKSDYMDYLNQSVQKSNVTVDSFRSEIEEKDGYTLFKYSLSILGDFPDVIRFFFQLNQEAKHIFVERYDIKLHEEKSVRMALRVEIVGVPGT